MDTSDFFTPKNAQLETRKEHLSLSGKYKLIVTMFATKPGCWNYTQGLIYAIGRDEPIGEIQRNYSSFPFLFIEDHPNGHPYLVGGSNYQGQTVIELDTGTRRDFLPEEAKQGHGFCWIGGKFDAATQTYVACGCIWAGPYEFRFYDFSDPMNGWPEIETSDYVSDDKLWPKFEPGGIVRCYETRYIEIEDDETDEAYEEREKNAPVDVIKTFRRDGMKLVLVEEWQSDYEKERQRKNEEARIAHEKWKAEFRSTDPLYLVYSGLLKDSALSPDEYEGIGQTYDGWCPDFKANERRWCRRIVAQKKDKKPAWTVDLEWGTDTGPIKVVVFKDGNTFETKFFEHTPESMRAAFTYAKKTIGATS
jgi:hypothetical protein